MWRENGVKVTGEPTDWFCESDGVGARCELRSACRTIGRTVIRAWNYVSELRKPEPHSVQMRDGVELSTRVWKPEGQGPFPVILERGYDPGIDWHAERFAGAGYAYVGQQCRGNLEGGMFRTDHVDGYDCMYWLVAQPWCNGDIAMYGRSFMGATQILTAPETIPTSGRSSRRSSTPQSGSGATGTTGRCNYRTSHAGFTAPKSPTT